MNIPACTSGQLGCQRDRWSAAEIERLQQQVLALKNKDDAASEALADNLRLFDRNAALEAAHVQMQASLDRMAGEKSYLSDEVIPALKAEVESLAAEKEHLLEALAGVVKDFVNPYDGGEFERGEIPSLDTARDALNDYQQEARREAAMQELADQAQELNMGYEGGQQSSVKEE